MPQQNLTKSELIAALAQRYPQLSTRDAEYAVKTILDAMSATLAQGQRIEIRGFGSFSLNVRPARTGRKRRSWCPRSVYRTSSRARICVRWSTIAKAMRTPTKPPRRPEHRRDPMKVAHKLPRCPRAARCAARLFWCRRGA